jgi:rhodanese-related sulfurtransferase
MANVNIISTEDLKARLEQGGKFEFWNVLSDEYFKGEFIPGSRRVPVDQVGREVAGTELPKDAEIVTYCGGPKCPQSLQAAEKLVTLGFTNVKAYEGGLEEWKAAGYSIDNQDTATAAKA